MTINASVLKACIVATSKPRVVKAADLNDVEDLRKEVNKKLITLSKASVVDVDFAKSFFSKMNTLCGQYDDDPDDFLRVMDDWLSSHQPKGVSLKNSIKKRTTGSQSALATLSLAAVPCFMVFNEFIELFVETGANDFVNDFDSLCRDVLRVASVAYYAGCAISGADVKTYMILVKKLGSEGRDCMGDGVGMILKKIDSLL